METAIPAWASPCPAPYPYSPSNENNSSSIKPLPCNTISPLFSCGGKIALVRAPRPVLPLGPPAPSCFVRLQHCLGESERGGTGKGQALCKQPLALRSCHLGFPG
ncbi:kalirin [Platysternon megacephalum]|uniref:Kalirin n=1 Tax=Platysternon megacephalum TaxID=55544 RepID=A0A4D9ELW0_9SAUR|nr:kalirin [Platysternon megacephalum]